MSSNISNAENIVTDNETGGNGFISETPSTPSEGEGQENQEPEEKPNTTPSTPTNSSTTSTFNNSRPTSNTQSYQKSSNASLSNLGIRPNDFTGFKAGTTTYDVTVPEEVEQIEVYATAQDAKASVTGTGMKSLEKGKNTISVVVTAESGTTKTYTINVTREETEENTENVQEQYSGDGLATLKVGDFKLSPEFDTNIYEYKVKYIGEDKKIDIDATATDPYYIIEITGNEDLEEGENLITILVSDPDGNNVATYQVTIDKSLVDEEALIREQEEAKKAEEQKKKLIIGAVIAVVAIGVIVFFIIRYRRNRTWAEDYSMPYDGLNNEEDYYYGDDYEEIEDKFEEFEEDNKEISKKQAREEFLDNYETGSYEDEYEEVDRTKRHRGKRFK